MPVLQEQKPVMAAWRLLLRFATQHFATRATRCRWRSMVKSCQVDSGLRHQSGQSYNGRSCASLRPRHTVYPAHKVERFEDHMGGAVTEWCLQFIAHLAGLRYATPGRPVMEHLFVACHAQPQAKHETRLA